ncbi:hypothetical protein [Rhodopirellula europaea]|uniref:hypothetical protein n=1 Tax=Rhodopirellula europaea TaxID=1263866 RepID=UPI003D2C482E
MTEQPKTFGGWTIVHRTSQKYFEGFPDIKRMIEDAVTQEFPGCQLVFQTFTRNADDPIALPPSGTSEEQVQSVRERLRDTYDRAIGVNRITPAGDAGSEGMPEPESSTSKAEDILGDWLVIVPMFQLEISDEAPINGCWSVGEVDFLSVQELGRRFSTRPSPPIWDRLVRDDVAFAVARITGKPSELRKTIFREFRRASEILAATGAFYGKRHHACGFTLKGYPSFTARNDRFFQLDGTAFCGNWNQHGYMHAFCLDEQWHQAVSQTGIIQLFSRLSDTSLDLDWRWQIGSAAAMLGRSMMSLDRADAFLLNVIGLETLLTRQGERNGRKLAKRIKGLTGWHLKTANPDYENEIKSIHGTRCAIVHDSDYDDLTIEMLLRADSYLANGLLNVVTNPGLFPTKDELVRIADDYADNENWPSDGTLSFKWFGNSNPSAKDLELNIW